jgi:hypothetical protein
MFWNVSAAENCQSVELCPYPALISGVRTLIVGLNAGVIVCISG